MKTIGIKRRYFPGYRKFKAIRHHIMGTLKGFDADGIPIEIPCDPYLLIVLKTGRVLQFHDIDKRDWFLHEVKE